MCPRRSTGRLAGLPILLLLACGFGCTMCPDPYDYSGPVPNGSPPHNDFRARSNGIRPLGATPQPFPPIVRESPKPDVFQASSGANDGSEAGQSVRPVAAEVILDDGSLSGG